MSKTLIVSISGIRGIFGNGLDPQVLVKFVSAYAMWCRSQTDGRPVVVVGRDARVTGALCQAVVAATLQSMGCDVIDAGLATTPTVEMAVLKESATGGIILSASHNPAEWNALKLLNHKGEFLSAAEGQVVLDGSQGSDFDYVTYDSIGSNKAESFLDYHIERILALPFIDPDAIAARNFKVVVDGVNSVGGVAIPALLRRLGVKDANIIRVNCEPTGLFSHPAEPLPENLVETCGIVADQKADIGIVVDPDADRLALIQDGGGYFSEELTQVAAAQFMWGVRSGPFVTNLSSSRAIDDIAASFRMEAYRSAVGEINVVEKMHEVGAILGGEGNGGVILPDLHHGRDALAGTAIILQHLSNQKMTMQELRRQMPNYAMVKLKKNIGDLNPDALLSKMAERYASEKISLVDGVKIDFEDGWVHMRRSNTEPIIRVYVEAREQETANALGNRFLQELVS
jgi:phosphomannomutase